MNFSLLNILFAFLQFLMPQAVPVVPAILSMQNVATAATTTVQLRLVPVQPISRAPIRQMNDSLGVAITARAALLTDARTGSVLWQKNQDEVRSIASITKLVSLMVVRERKLDDDALIEITKEDYTPLGYHNFSIGEQVKAKDVFAAVLIASDNTAMNALARSTGFSRDDFVREMNALTRSLGLAKTHFVDPTGLSDGNISTAAEVLSFAQRAFADPYIRNLASRRAYTFTSESGTVHMVKTTNMLIGSMIKIVAGKTGFVTESGYNIVSEATNKQGENIFGVVLGSATNVDRFQDFKMLAYWAWQNFTWPAA